MKKIELLAPAGTMESLYAAVQMGADAVYLGGTKFSARAYASNFDEETMQKAIEYCHLYGVKVYVTINTLIKEEEIEEALEYAGLLYKMGVDAIIIQDVGLTYLIRKYLPDLEIHASTQMTVHNGEGALFLKKKGFQRIVLSRELSLGEIAFISKNLGVETEIFVHGALCICYSGQCLMSSLIGGRSGNRGRCAQPCRLPYTLVNNTEGSEKSAYLLSPKDICTLDRIPEIIGSGTSSLKIEGRMKRPEYVAGVVEAYRKAIDAVYEGKDFELDKENKKLLQLFNREGFSKGYLYGNEGKSMMAYSFPKNTGVFLGKVERDLTILLEEDIVVRDGIRVGEEGFTIAKIERKGEVVGEAIKGEKVRLFPTQYKVGEKLFKTADTVLTKSLEQAFVSPYQRKISLPLQVHFGVGEPLCLQTKYKDHTFTYKGEVVQKAVNKPLAQERIVENLQKAGDTPFKFEEIQFQRYEEGFLPIGAINGARRDIILQVETFVKGKGENTKHKEGFAKEVLQLERKNKKVLSGSEENRGEVITVVSTLSQYKAAKECKVKDIAISLFQRREEINMDEVEAERLYIKIPNIIRNEFEEVCKRIEELLPRVQGIITGNLGIIQRFKERTKIIGHYKLNLFNSFVEDFYGKDIVGFMMSLELNKKEIEKVLNLSYKPSYIYVYGKPELMVSEYCPIGCTFGNKDKEKSCKGVCEKGTYLLRDRKGETFSIKTDSFCRSYIYNGKAINLIPHIEELKKIKGKYWVIEFIDENYKEAIEVLTAFLVQKWEKGFEGYTRGHLKRGVE